MANGIIVLVNSETGLCCRFFFHNFTKRHLAHYFPYNVKLRLLAHSRSYLTNQKARNAIVGAENLLNKNKLNVEPLNKEVSQWQVLSLEGTY